MGRMDKDLYARLGVSKDAEPSEIKKAFKKLAMTHHPDKGGDPEEFKKIQHAHEVLTDETKRKMYDMTGSEDGEMPQGMPFGGVPFDMGDLFGGLFGMPGMGGGPGPRAASSGSSNASCAGSTSPSRGPRRTPRNWTASASGPGCAPSKPVRVPAT